MQRLLLACLLAAPVGAQEAATAPPNLIVILVDDFGYECVGANGGESYATPRLDQMAAEGVRFTRAYSTPLCTPSRVQLMTGRYGFRNYVRFGYLDPEERTFAQLLRSAGYATCIVGKWQLTYGDIDPERPRQLGFGEWCLWNSRRQPGSRYADPQLDVNGEVREFSGGYGPDVTRDFAFEFLERQKDGPFLLYWPMILTHAPFEPTPDSGEGEQDSQAHFADMVAYTDSLVGQLLDELEELGIAERTLVLFLGDNGTPLQITSGWNGEEVRGGKSFLTEAGTRVPCIAYWPGGAKPSVLDDVVDFTDVLPTLCDAAGVAPPEELVLDGRSVLPRLRGEPGDPREWIVCHYDPKWNVPGAPGRFAHDGRFKLYHDGRLYDVWRDWREAEPLPPDHAASAAAREQLQAALDDLPAWDPPAQASRPERQ